MDVKQHQAEARPTDQCWERQEVYLEYERWAGLQLQQAGAAQRLEHGVWVVAESLVDHQHGAHVVHDEPDLVGAAAGLWEAFIRACHRGRQTHHHGVVDNRAVLHKKRGNIKEGGRKGRADISALVFLLEKRCKNMILNDETCSCGVSD